MPERYQVSFLLPAVVFGSLIFAWNAFCYFIALAGGAKIVIFIAVSALVYWLVYTSRRMPVRSSILYVILMSLFTAVVFDFQFSGLKPDVRTSFFDAWWPFAKEFAVGVFLIVLAHLCYRQFYRDGR